MKSSRLCKEDYGQVKRMVGMRQAAEFYGYPVSRRGLCRCPFHPDRHPSMKIYPNDRGFYCFSCQEGGDVVKFVARLYGIRNEEACRKLIEDFSLPVQTEFLTYREKREQEKRRRKRREVDAFAGYAYATLKVYWMLLCEASRTPKDPHFAEALQELSIVEYRLECLREDAGDYYQDRKAVKKIGEIRDRIIGWYDLPEAGGAISGGDFLSDPGN
ncbi:MAG TPA: hypothetical protein IAA44_12455 [Candidatus Blautia avistercoris]|nr:hypothetical protein [Candidatus Blautia avistercoris]